MKILLAIDQMAVGGIENWLITTIKALLAHDHEPVALVMSRSGPLLSRLEATGVLIRSITDNVKELGFYKPGMIKAFRQVVREESPDVVHLCDVISGHIGRIACIGLGLPVIYHLRSTVPHGKRKYRVASSLLSFSTNKFITVSQAVADKVLSRENWANRPYSVLFNCIDQDRYVAVKPDLSSLPNIGPDDRIIVSCSRLVPSKNTDQLIRAFVKVRDKVSGVRFLILGDGPEKANLEDLAVSLGVAEDVCFAGFREDIPALFKGLGARRAVFAMPSDYEGFSNALTEALYCGVPAVISRYVPNREMTGDAAKVVGRNPEELSTALVEILTDDVLFAKMRRAALDGASELTADNYVRKLIEVYQSVVRPTE